MSQGIVTDLSMVPGSAMAVPALYCPDPIRDDDALAREVDRLVFAWIERTGIFAGRLEQARRSRFGRFAMLVHPDTDDPGRLLVAAQCMAALFAVDDQYCDDDSAGSDPHRLAPRLSLALAAVEPVHLVGGYDARLEQALRDDPVRVALRDYFEAVARLGTPAQVARVRHETVAMFVTMTAEAAWRTVGELPGVWEYLAQRQVNSFLPCMVLIDVIGGYEVPASLYADPVVRRASALAASATIYANDLYSAAKESRVALGDFNLPRLLAAEEGCSPEEAMRRAVALHDAVMRAYEDAESDALALHGGVPTVRRYLAGLRAWIAGSRAWHHDSGRYHPAR